MCLWVIFYWRANPTRPRLLASGYARPLLARRSWVYRSWIRLSRRRRRHLGGQCLQAQVRALVRVLVLTIKYHIFSTLPSGSGSVDQHQSWCRTGLSWRPASCSPRPSRMSCPLCFPIHWERSSNSQAGKSAVYVVSFLPMFVASAGTTIPATPVSTGRCSADWCLFRNRPKLMLRLR